MNRHLARSTTTRLGVLAIASARGSRSVSAFARSISPDTGTTISESGPPLDVLPTSGVSADVVVPTTWTLEAEALQASQTVFVLRGVRLYLSALVATSCLVAAAYLAFDWADYGADSTCGNFIRRAPWTGPCSEIMWHRVFAVIGLVIFTSVVLLVGLLGWLRRDKHVVS
jgi:hypothetical protein